MPHCEQYYDYSILDVDLPEIDAQTSGNALTILESLRTPRPDGCVSTMVERGRKFTTLTGLAEQICKVPVA